ncbi:uncharacterized protein V1510DRAFT_367875, partial [Dipodascopsis tothii]|uniref:uncharacterized protein n=1 Tax=Dipodascopsis tothii TaxID=44089 RepID=UPI0034CF6298
SDIRQKFTARSVWLSTTVSIGSTVVVFVAFCVLRPRHTVVYAPKTRQGVLRPALTPPKLQTGYVAWITEVWRQAEEKYVDRLGLDAVVYLHYNKMVAMVFIALALLGTAVIIPVNVVCNLKSGLANSGTYSDAFILMTPILLSGSPLIAHVVMTYVFDAIVCLFLWRSYRHIVHLKQVQFRSSSYTKRLAGRTLLINEIPKSFRSAQGLLTISTTAGATQNLSQLSIGRDIRNLENLVVKRESYVLDLESAFAKYANDVVRPSLYRRVFGINIPKMAKNRDRIVEIHGEIKQLEQEIILERNSMRDGKPMPYGFVAYTEPQFAHEVALSNYSKSVQHSHIRLAPRAEDIIWSNIALTKPERMQKQHSGRVVFIALCIGYIVPNAFISTFLTQISHIGTFWPWFKNLLDDHPTFFSFIQGIISPLVVSAIFLVLPVIMRRISSWQGSITKSSRERDTLNKLHIFFVFNNLIVFTIFGAVWSAVSEIVETYRDSNEVSVGDLIESLDLPSQLSSSIIGVSSFWVTYILKVNLTSVIDLIQLTQLLKRSFKKKFRSTTPRQQIEWTAPPDFQYAKHYNAILFYITLALAFATIQPLILIVTACYLCLDSFLKKYSLTYVFVTKVESDGTFWKVLFNRTLVACVFGDLFLFPIVWAQGGWIMAMGLVPLPLILLSFKTWCLKEFDKQEKFLCVHTDASDEESLAESDSAIALNPGTDIENDSDLRLVFTNSALYRKLIVPMIDSRFSSVLADLACLQGDNAAAIALLDAHPVTGQSDQQEKKGRNKRWQFCEIESKFELVSEQDLDIVQRNHMDGVL